MIIGERDIIDARREALETEFFSGSNDERFSALDPDFEIACDNAREDIDLPDWVVFEIGPSLTHMVIQPEPCQCPICVPF